MMLSLSIVADYGLVADLFKVFRSYQELMRAKGLWLLVILILYISFAGCSRNDRKALTSNTD